MEKLLQIINIVLKNSNKKELSSLTDNMHLRYDIGFDSINLAELTVRIEDEFGIDIFSDGIVDTVGEVLKKINNE